MISMLGTVWGLGMMSHVMSDGRFIHNIIHVIRSGLGTMPSVGLDRSCEVQLYVHGPSLLCGAVC